MDLILNDGTLHGQFDGVSAFEDYLVDVFLPILNIAVDYKISIYKFENIYTCKVYGNTSLVDLLHNANGASPSRTKLRQLIIQLIDDPFLDLDSKTDQSASYSFPGTLDIPNCYSEAIERCCPLFSFELEKEQLEKKLLCEKNGKGIEIPVIYNKNNLLLNILEKDQNSFIYVLENYRFKKTVNLAYQNGACILDECNKHGLTLSDLNMIIVNLDSLIDDLNKGRKSRFWDKLEKNLLEYRLHISAGREYRILFHWGETLTLLCSFVKKSKETPKLEKERARNILKTIVNSEKSIC